MKKIKSILIASAIVAIAGTLFAFNVIKNKDTKALVLPRCFQFTGNTSSTADLTNPQKWVEVSCNSLSCPNTNILVCGLRIKQDEATYIYSAGPNANHPKVDVNPPSPDFPLSNDALKAGGHSGGGVQTVTNTDYETYTKTN